MVSFQRQRQSELRLLQWSGQGIRGEMSLIEGKSAETVKIFKGEA